MARKISIWIESTRPYSLIAAISPVIIGTSIASIYHSISWIFFIAALAFSVTLQIGTNWANDYFDFVKGCDTEKRKAPFSVLQLGLITPRLLAKAFIWAHCVALILAIPLIFRVGLVFTPLALLCIAASLLYTGGKKPLGYLGYGDFLVFLFFGPIGTCGSALIQLHEIPLSIIIASLIPGALSLGILSINHLRDVEEDKVANKKTLVVRFGSQFGEIEYLASLFVALLSPLLLVIFCHFSPLIFILWILLPLYYKPLSIVFTQPELYNRALAQTAQLLTLNTIIFISVILCLTASGGSSIKN